MPDAVDAGDGVLDFFRHLRLKLRRRGARLGDEHLDDWNVDVRKSGDRHRPEADQAENRQHRERNDRGDGFADRPGGDVEAHRRAPYPLAAVVSGVGRTRSPDLKKTAARVIPLSPSVTPAWISTQSPSAMPGFTWRVSTLSSRTTSRRAASPSRSNAVAGTPTPWRRASSTDPEAKAPIWARETSPSAIRTLPVRLAFSTSWFPRRAKAETRASPPCRCGSLCRLPGSRGGQGLRPALRRPAASVPPACRRRGGRASARARRPRDRPLHPQ